MIDKYEIDPDGFNAEVNEHVEMLRAQDLPYEQLLMVAARAMTEAKYNEGVYHCDLDDAHRSIEQEVRNKNHAEKRATMATMEGIVASERAHRLAEDLKSAPSRAALKAAKAKLAKDKDGKQEAKRFVEDCWKDWQKKPDSYSGQAEFARDMLSKCENLKSQPAIENWCREWKKKNTH